MNEAVLATIAKFKRPPERFHSGVGHLGGKDYQLCWEPIADGGIGLMYDDGDSGSIDQDELHPAPEA